MALLGLVNKKERWGLSWRGWLTGICFCMAVAVILGLTVQPFLAINRPVGRGILVVEGWMPEYALVKAIELHEAKVYDHIVTTGEVIAEGTILAEYGTSADLCKTRLMLLGMKEEDVTAVSSPRVPKDRTYAMGLALRDWFGDPNGGLAKLTDAVDVLTLDIHARRSQILYQMALGENFEVGVIAYDNSEYDQHRWWVSSFGIKVILNESLSYLYTIAIFKPIPDMLEEFIEETQLESKS